MGTGESELRRIRKARELPQEILSRRARIGQSTLSAYERGEKPVPRPVAVRLARILRVDLAELKLSEVAK